MLHLFVSRESVRKFWRESPFQRSIPPLEVEARASIDKIARDDMNEEEGRELEEKIDGGLEKEDGTKKEKEEAKI